MRKARVSFSLADGGPMACMAEEESEKKKMLRAAGGE
jgi:hypothetical protein